MSTGGWTTRSDQTASSANVEDLQREMVLIREALNKLQCEETFIVQGRTRRHHVIAIPERTNHPSQWSTRCGWKYGHGKFYRTNIIESDATRCARCFQLEQEGHNEPSPASLSDSGDHSDSSSSSSSSRVSS